MKRITAYAICSIALLLQPLQAHLDPRESLDQIVRKLEAAPEDTSLLLDKAHILIRMGSLDEAESVLQQVEGLEPDRSADTAYLYILLYQKSGDLEAAFKMSDWGIKRYPDNFYQWEIRGQIALSSGETDAAIEALTHSLELNDKGSSRGYLFVSNLLLERNADGDKEAVLVLLQMGNIKLNYPSELLNMSIKLNMELGRYDEALDNINKLENNYGAQAPFAIKRAEILELAGRNIEAVGAYDEAIALLKAMPAGKQNNQVDNMIAMLERAKAMVQPADANP